MAKKLTSIHVLDVGFFWQFLSPRIKGKILYCMTHCHSPENKQWEIIIAIVSAIVSKPDDGKNLPSTFSQQICGIIYVKKKTMVYCEFF